MKLKGKVAIVTGASGGIGRAAALLFAQEGAHLESERIWGRLDIAFNNAGTLTGCGDTTQVSAADWPSVIPQASPEPAHMPRARQASWD